MRTLHSKLLSNGELQSGGAFDLRKIGQAQWSGIRPAKMRSSHSISVIVRSASVRPSISIANQLASGARRTIGK